MGHGSIPLQFMLSAIMFMYGSTFQLLYPPTSADLLGVGTCELSANAGHSFCDLGPADCIDSPQGPKCRSEIKTANAVASPLNNGILDDASNGNLIKEH